ncbi:MAG: hypothetical protein UU61_C0016G0013 [Parcubacteria group bacterium GW2011_GWB1_41_4]|nr:MAG: hypothetical protein UU61_C0016G0013 [Parcubacteria group bacterium GW2011_GWB1_41_4]
MSLVQASVVNAVGQTYSVAVNVLSAGLNAALRFFKGTSNKIVRLLKTGCFCQQGK